MRIAVLYGSMSENTSKDEQDGLVQVDSVSKALSELNHDPVPVSFSLDVKETLKKIAEINPALVFNLVESIDGQGRLIHLAPSILDAMNMAYTGAGTDAIYTTSNKILAKQILRGAGIPTPVFVTPENAGQHKSPICNPGIIKSVWEHGSVGIGYDSVVFPKTRDQLLREMDRRKDQLGGACFTEAFIEGREFNLSLLAKNGNGIPQVLPPAEIRFENYPEDRHKIVDYKAKWESESFEYQHTVRAFDFPDQDRPLLDRIEKIARQCWNLFNLKGYARVDFRVDASGNPWVLEVNTNPCIAPDSGFVAAAHQADLSFKHVIERILHEPLVQIMDRLHAASDGLPWKIAVNE
ncbi:MAG: ATP-grasp domain-containing protein [Deltaproteobacteria bacterium]|nr:ATP-grasp domain-containing protein [Deltaproteobacteria bacterium]